MRAEEYTQLERRRSDLAATNDNSARLARVALLHKTVGAGEIKVLDPLLFEIAFLGVPLFTSGYEVQTVLTSLHFPQATAFVWEWVMTKKDRLCIGAKVGFVVDDAGGLDLQHNIVHHLHFEGPAVKVMPADSPHMIPSGSVVP